MPLKNINETSLTPRPPRPPAPDVENIPLELKLQIRWLCWRYSDRPNKRGKYGKIPFTIADKQAKYTDSASWLPFAAALQQYQRGGYDGIGIVLGELRPGCYLCGYDADHCVEWSDNGTVRWNPAAAANIRLLDSYSEFSLSDGAHCIAVGSLPEGRRKGDDHELYCSRRFLVVTGRRLKDAPTTVNFREQELHDLHARLFPKNVTQLRPNTRRGREREEKEESIHTEYPSSGASLGAIYCTGRDGDREQVNVGEGDARLIRLNDQQIVKLILKDQSASVYWRACPEGMNPSRADWALARKLAFYCGRNVEQMIRVFRRSGLCNRIKDDSRRGEVDYVTYTCQRAASAQKCVWHPATTPIRKAPVGRPLSDNTKRVLDLANQEPQLSAAAIDRRLHLTKATARQILHRHLSGRRSATGAEHQDMAA